MYQQKTALLVVLALVSLTLCAYPPKRLAGPIEEFNLHRIVDPASVITKERSVSQYIWFDTSLGNGAVYTSTIPVDASTEFVLSFASPQESKLELTLVDPTGKPVDLAAIKTADTFPIGETIKVPISTYIVKNSVQGFYTFTITLNGLSVQEADNLAENPFPNAILTVFNNDDLEIHSHLSSYLIDVGDTIGIVSSLVNLNAGVSPNDIHVTRAAMEIITPDGEDIEVEMHNEPTLAGADSSFGAVITAKIPGDYLIQARLEGWIGGGVATPAVPFTRTTEHVIGVSASSLSIAGTASLRADDQTHAWIDVDVKQVSTENTKALDTISFRAYAEVWGVEATTGAPKAACWVGGLTDVSKQANGEVLSLQVDLRWLQRAGVQAPLTLRNVYVTDMATSFPVATFDNEIPVKSSGFSVKLSAELLNMAITREMRVGVNPLPVMNASKPTAAPTLFPLPGYCASVNPWTQEHFSGAGFFIEQGNFGHDEYAKKVMAYIETQNPTSFSFLGHSQGGFVSLHISNYYFTPLENAKGGRLIQTVGTPWGGCTAAGDAASLGSVFGIGCGTNSDLTRDGAINWLSGISLESRKSVHSYTTTYSLGGFFGDYCSLPMNMVLQWPNDGTTELTYGKLEGGVYEGNTEKQCHTTGMAYTYKVQTHDQVRNALLNTLAAR